MDALLEKLKLSVSGGHKYFRLANFLNNYKGTFSYQGIVDLPAFFCILFEGSLDDNMKQIIDIAYPDEQKRKRIMKNKWSVYDVLALAAYDGIVPFSATKRRLADLPPYYTPNPDRINTVVDALMLETYFSEFKHTIIAANTSKLRIEIGDFPSKCAPLPGSRAASLVASLPKNHIVIPFNYRGDYANPYLVSLLEEYSANKQGFFLQSRAPKEISVNIPTIFYRKKNDVVMEITEEMIIKHFVTADIKEQGHPFFFYRTIGGLEGKGDRTDQEYYHFVLSIANYFESEEYHGIFEMVSEQRIAHRNKHNIGKIVDDGDDVPITAQLFHLMYKLFLNYDCFVFPNYKDSSIFQAFAGFCNYTREDPEKGINSIYIANDEGSVTPYQKGFFDGIEKTPKQLKLTELKSYIQTEEDNIDEYADEPEDIDFADQMSPRDVTQKPYSPPVAQYASPVAQYASPVAQKLPSPVAQKLPSPVAQYASPVLQFVPPVTQKLPSPPAVIQAPPAKQGFVPIFPPVKPQTFQPMFPLNIQTIQGSVLNFPK